MPNYSNTSATSISSGFQNYTVTSGSVSVGAQVLGAFGFQQYYITIPLNNSNAVSEVQTKCSLDSYWNLVDGTVVRRYPDWATSNYEISSMVYFTGGNLIIYTYLVELTGAPQAIPAFTIDARAFLFKAPF